MPELGEMGRCRFRKRPGDESDKLNLKIAKVNVDVAKVSVGSRRLRLSAISEHADPNVARATISGKWSVVSGQKPRKYMARPLTTDS